MVWVCLHGASSLHTKFVYIWVFLLPSSACQTCLQYARYLCELHGNFFGISKYPSHPLLCLAEGFISDVVNFNELDFRSLHKCFRCMELWSVGVGDLLLREDSLSWTDQHPSKGECRKRYGVLFGRFLLWRIVDTIHLMGLPSSRPLVVRLSPRPAVTVSTSNPNYIISLCSNVRLQRVSKEVSCLVHLYYRHHNVSVRGLHLISFNKISNVWTLTIATAITQSSVQSPQLSVIFVEQVLKLVGNNYDSHVYGCMVQHSFPFTTGERMMNPRGCPDRMYNEVMLQCWAHAENTRPRFAELLKIIKSIRV